MNRGSANSGNGDTRAKATFNEAPIHESGKFGGIGGGCRRGRPSMRPRFMNRGSGGIEPHMRL